MSHRHSPVRKTRTWVALAAAATGALGLLTPIATASPAPLPNPGKEPTAAVYRHTLHINGTNTDDTITIWMEPGQPKYLYLRLNPQKESIRFDRSTFSAIDVRLFDGNDYFVASDDVKKLSEDSESTAVAESAPTFDELLTVDAGRGNDRLWGSPGGDRLLGGAGDDIIDGLGGHDVIDAGAGNDQVSGGRGNDGVFLGVGADSARWSAGDGRDVIDGGPGNDVLGVKGSAKADSMSIKARGRIAVVQANEGSLTITGMENAFLAPGTGADTVRIGSLAGTGMASVAVDLYSQKNPDRMADTVYLEGTTGADRLTVGVKEKVVVVAGMTPAVAIGGADDAMDRLRISTGRGWDRVTVSPDAMKVMDIKYDLGRDQQPRQAT